MMKYPVFLLDSRLHVYFNKPFGNFNTPSIMFVPLKKTSPI